MNKNVWCVSGSRIHENIDYLKWKLYFRRNLCVRRSRIHLHILSCKWKLDWL